MIVHVDQMYREVGGVPLRYDFFRPDGETKLPLVIGIHGGGWISGCKEDYREFGLTLAYAGFAVALPQYRLAPLHPYPSCVDDLKAFMSFAREHADEWGIDPTKVAVVGNSAGGYLAAMLGLAATSEERANLAFPICPVTDLTAPRETHLPIAWSFVEQFMPLPFEGNEATFEEASPLKQVHPGAAPFVIFHGDADDVVPVEQSDQLAHALDEAGVPVEYRRMPGEGHSFTLEGWTFIEERVIDKMRETFA